MTSVQQGTERPNVIVVFADQLRARSVGFAGDPNVKTPHMDRLAESGMVFDNAISNCPVCTPARGMMLTGRFPLSNRTVVNDLGMPADEVGVAELFGRAGYRTGYVGKWHLDGIPRGKFTPPGPRRHGFDTFWAAYECTHDYFHPKYYLDTDELVERDGYEPEVQTGLAIDFIQRHGSEPFCLFVSWGPPHAPYELVPERYRRMYDADTIELPANFRDGDRRALADYYAAVTALDENLGRIMHAIDSAGIAERTILVFTSDHGDMLWSQGRLKKQQPWEESIAVPLVMSSPGRIAEGSRRDDLFGLVDLAPTLLSLAGLDVPDYMEGVDLSEAVLGGAGPARTSIPIMDIVCVDQARTWGGTPWRGVRTKQHTYARFQDAGWVLYDNLKDPEQMNNLLDDPASRGVRDALEGELQEWLRVLGDGFLTGEEHIAALGLSDEWAARQRHFYGGKNNW